MRHPEHEALAKTVRGCRSVLLNTDVDDTPIRLYRRMGFTDEVYWTQEYILNPRG